MHAAPPATRPSVTNLLSLVALLLATAACGDGGTGPLGPSDLVVASGDEQRGVVGSPLGDPLVVEVTDASGDPVAGIEVSWSVEAGPGQLSAGRSTTGGQGLASVTLTPTALGEIEVAASVASAGTVRFTAAGHVVVADPADDTFETEASDGLVPPDVQAMSAWPGTGVLVVELVFTEPVVSEGTGGANVVVGFLDIDVDQDPATGLLGAVDLFNPAGPSSGLGVDYLVELSTGAGGLMRVVDVQGQQSGSLLPDFEENVLTLRIPLGALGNDDGRADLAVVVGTPPQATDVAPDVSNLSMSTGAAPAPMASSGRLRHAVGLRW